MTGFVAVQSVEAQRHPEAAEPQPYYRTTGGSSRSPTWTKRPEFIRGPLDRTERGRYRLFLAIRDYDRYTNNADLPYLSYQNTSRYNTQGRPFWMRRVGWDRMGNYMGGSYQRLFSIEEGRGSNGSGFSLIDHKALPGWVDRAASMRIGHYTHKSLNWTVTGGEDIRTYFTPLTLMQSHMSCARLDLDYGNRQQMTVLYSRGGNGLFSKWGLLAGDSFEPASVQLYGLHLNHKMSRGMGNVGATFLAQVMAQPGSRSSDLVRGDLPYDMVGPSRIRVHIADDSPHLDASGALVYDMDIVLAGERGGEKVIMTSQESAEGYSAQLEPSIQGRYEEGAQAYVARGEEGVIYEFNLPDDLTVDEVSFAADLSGDYNIGVRQTHAFHYLDRKGNAALKDVEWPQAFKVQESVSRRPFKWYTDDPSAPTYTVERADRAPRENEARRTLSFDYGIPSGQNIVSTNGKFMLVGLNIDGEIAFNRRHYIYPHGENAGYRYSRDAWAYWITLDKKLSTYLDLGGEVFRIDGDYGGGFDSYRGGSAFHVDRQVGPNRTEHFTQEYGLVEDNDDDDMWPDESPEEVAVFGDAFPGWSNANVYPGMDENSDNIADGDRNENFIPDYEEPFLMYDADPMQFVYGVDFNNNSIPDFRENDDLPDYPYRRDSRGYNTFLAFAAKGSSEPMLTFGKFDLRARKAGTKSRGYYLRAGYGFKRRGRLEADLHFESKRVWDNIPDHTYDYRIPPDDPDILPWLNTPTTPPERTGILGIRAANPDMLFMRNSWVNSSHIKVAMSPLAGLDFDNSIIYFRNQQMAIDEPGQMQEAATRTRSIMINRISYTITRGALSIRPRLKHRVRRETVGVSSNSPHMVSEFIPIVSGEYALTEYTRLMIGIQGLPLLPYRYTDHRDALNSFSAIDRLIMLKIKRGYFGIAENALFIGYHYRKLQRDEAKDHTQQSKIFVELISPF